MNRPTCFNCTYALKSPGFPGDRLEPPEPPEADCQHEEVTWEFVEDLFNSPESYKDDPYALLAERCGHYNPVLIRNCGYCGREINSPEWSHKLWSYQYDNIAVCSQKCKEGADKEFDRHIQEMCRGESW